MSMGKDVYLTLDLDWASDEVLDYSIELLESYSVEATFFVTHDTPLLQKIHKNVAFELGIHPNFNKQLFGQELRDYHSIIDELFEIVPEAVSYRSHALTQNSNVSVYLAQKGIRYDLNVYIPIESHMILHPYNQWWGGLMMPFFFEDDIWFSNPDRIWDVERYYNKDGLKIFNFHPIHIFLNTENAARYESSRNISRDIQKLDEIRNRATRGTMDMLVAVIEYGKRHQYEFKKVSQITY